MCISITEHVRTYGRGCDPKACVFPKLKAILRQKMQQRGLLALPPKYLGYEAPNWNAPEAFDDLVADCYLFAIADRKVGLQKQLKVLPNVEGLVRGNVSKFLTERQRRRDPTGYAVFGNLQQAISELVAAGKVAVDGLLDGRLRSSTMVRLDPAALTIRPGDPVALEAALEGVAELTEALADLASTSNKGITWMAEFLGRLRAAGITSFRVSDLVSLVASRVRADQRGRHAGRATDVSQEGQELVPLVFPDQNVNAQEIIALLKRVVPERIAQERQQRVRNSLMAVFNEWIGMIEDSGHDRPNQVELAERLGMSDATLSDYLKRLRQIIAGILREKSDG